MELKDSDYDFEIERIIKEIKQKKAKTVVLQFPDGLKPFAKEIVLKLKKETKAEIYLWGSSNFGACDIPKTDADLLIHFGHTQWN
jgi:2-(3-amino-3-carboxypropyl)histidine synthase